MCKYFKYHNNNCFTQPRNFGSREMIIVALYTPLAELNILNVPICHMDISLIDKEISMYYTRLLIQEDAKLMKIVIYFLTV